MADTTSTVIAEIMDKLQTATENLMTTANDVSLAEDNLATHNVSPDAHADIRQLISEANSVSEEDLSTIKKAYNNVATDSLIVDGIPDILIPGATHNFTFSAITSVDDTDVVYSLVNVSSNITVAINSTEFSGILAVKDVAQPGSVANFGIMVQSQYGSATKIFSFKIASSVDGTNLATNNLLTAVKPGGSYNITFSGVDSNNGDVKYTVEPVVEGVLSFTPNIDILPHFPITMNVAANASRGSLEYFDVKAIDASGMSVTKRFVVAINSLPVITNVICNNLPANIDGNSEMAINFTGMSDANSAQTLTANIKNISSGLIFAKTSGILNGESVVVKVEKVPAAATKSFTLELVDSLGEVSSSTKTFSVLVNPIYNSVTPSINYPTQGEVVPFESFNITFTPYAQTVDLS